MSKNMYYAASTHDMGEVLEVGNKLKWTNKTKGFFTREIVDECRQACNAEYFIEEEDEKFIPPADPALGRSKSYPARDCKDILENGPGAVSGKFYVRPSE